MSKYLQIVLGACFNLFGVADRWDLPGRENKDEDTQYIKLVSNHLAVSACWHFLWCPHSQAEGLSNTI